MSASTKLCYEAVGFTIASCGYIHTEMEKEQTLQQILEMVKTRQKKADAGKKRHAGKNGNQNGHHPGKNKSHTRGNAGQNARKNTSHTEETKSGQAEMRFIICTLRSQLKGTNQREMRAAIQSARSELDETTTTREATETEPDPGMMQSIEEHHDIPRKRPQ
jgi:hypothetical protein